MSEPPDLYRTLAEADLQVRQINKYFRQFDKYDALQAEISVELQRLAARDDELRKQGEPDPDKILAPDYARLEKKMSKLPVMQPLNIYSHDNPTLAGSQYVSLKSSFDRFIVALIKLVVYLAVSAGLIALAIFIFSHAF